MNTELQKSVDAFNEVITQIEARQRVLAAMERSLKALQDDKRDDMICAWNYGLGVKYCPDGTAIAVALYEATTVDCLYPVVRNGAGVQAHVVRRQVVITEEVEKILRLLDSIQIPKSTAEVLTDRCELLK